MNTEKEYLVLARKYRPSNFKELMGQEALVQTITNAIKANRIAHAFILTGIRGVGKTTSARIIAKALNCAEGPTAEPCGKCEQCISIAEDRNVDVIETDAASRTGVDDIREIIDNVQYMPVSGRYKIYIIDEVHMLSKNAFNALLKTLEEPPPHVKFIFATTEIRKIPLTILSRCQRFDLARVETNLLTDRFTEIANLESYTIEPGAAELIAKAAQGSVRDGLSILDRILSSSDGKITENQVRELLGISDSSKIFDLFEAVVSGNIKDALRQLRKMHHEGSDVVALMEDLLELTHFLTQININPEAAAFSYVEDTELGKAKQIAEKLSVPFLVRAWQILLKGIGEIKMAPNPITAAEMVVIKLAYTSDLPVPGDLLKDPSKFSIKDQEKAENTPAHEPADAPLLQKKIEIRNFKDLVDLFAAKEELFLHQWLKNDVHLVSFEKNRLEFRPSATAPKDLAGRISNSLREWTGERWVVIISNESGSKTLKEEEQESFDKARSVAIKHSLVEAVMETFPGAKIKEVRQIKKQEILKEENVSTLKTGEA